MASILLVVKLIAVLLFYTKCSFGNTCDCDMVRFIMTNEIFDLKVENQQLVSRIEKIELAMSGKTPVYQSTKPDTGRIEMMETRINYIESKMPDSKTYSGNLQSLIPKWLRSEKIERVKSEMKIAAGLKEIDDSLKIFKVKSDAILVSHIGNISDRVGAIKMELSENISLVRKEVMTVSNQVVKLANQTSFLIENNITTIEMSMDAMSNDCSKMDAYIDTMNNDFSKVGADMDAMNKIASKMGSDMDAMNNDLSKTGADMEAMNNDFSKMEADIKAVIDIVLLEQKAECTSDCANGGVCFRNNTCKCKPFTEGPRCEKVICEDKCYENGGKCIGPGTCKCPEDRQGSNCEQQACPLPDVTAKHEYERKYFSQGEKLTEFNCDPGFILLPKDGITCLANGSWSGIIECATKETCEEGWSFFNRRCFKYIDKSASWESAQTACGESGGGLVEITSAAVNAFLVNLRKETDIHGATAWIGLKRADDTYIWYPSENVASFLNWSKWEPNNHQSMENCVEMYDSGKWNDRSCTRTRKYFCEKPPTVIPY